MDPSSALFTNANYSSAKEPSGIIIAGTGRHERTFSASQSALEKSTVIRGWIEDKESIPSSLQKGDALYFPECDPEVVHATIKYLNSTTNGLIAIRDTSARGSRDVLFYVKLYKFALCLGLNELCVVSLNEIKELVRDTKSFIHVLSASTDEKTSLVDNHQFHGWMMGYIAEKSEVLKESALFKSAIMQDSELAWRLCSLLISSLVGMGIDTRAHSLQPSTSSPLRAPPNEAPSSDTTPPTERRSPYSCRPQQKSPSPRQDINRIKKKQKHSARKFSASVEDAIDREYLSVKHKPDD